MPTYEYLCRQCGHRFEAWQHMTDDPLTVCPQCGAAIHRVLYPAGIVFKGSGFYKTEYGSGNGGNGAHASEHDSGEKPAESEKKSEKKSESGASKSAAETRKSAAETSKSVPAKSPTTPAKTAAD